MPRIFSTKHPKRRAKTSGSSSAKRRKKGNQAESGGGQLENIRLAPETVTRCLKDYLNLLLQDHYTLSQWWDALKCDSQPSKTGIPTLDYIRARLMFGRRVSEHSPPQQIFDWHPFILEYCKRLGCDPEPVDRLFQRLQLGDILDRRVTLVDYKAAIGQLEQAIARADKQYLAAAPVIHALVIAGNQMVSEASAGPSRPGRKAKRDEPKFREVIELYERGNGPKAIVEMTGYPMRTVNCFLSRHRKRQKRAADK